MTHALTVFLLALLLTGCSRPEFVNANAAKEYEKRRQEGWSYVDTVGTETADAVLLMWSSSGPGAETTVNGVTDGKEIKKVFPKDSRYHLACFFGTEKSGLAFTLLFHRKDEPPAGNEPAISVKLPQLQ